MEFKYINASGSYLSSKGALSFFTNVLILRQGLYMHDTTFHYACDYDTIHNEISLCFWLLQCLLILTYNFVP